MSTVTLEKTNNIARVTLNKPPLNVMDIAMMEELDAALKSLKGDRASKVIVIAAAGKAFSAGVDVADHTKERVDEMIKKFDNIFRTLWSLEQPTVAAVQGMALGGGCEVAIGCDFVVASEKAKFGQPEIKVGVFPPVAALVLTGETFFAREAERIGLVNVVAPPESFDAAVNAFVGKLTALSGVVLRLAKRATRIGLDQGADAAFAEIERLYLRDLMQAADAAEGLAAFLEKRAPVWKE